MEYILIIEIKFVASDEKLSGINGNHKTKNIQVNSRIKNSLNDIYTFFTLIGYSGTEKEIRNLNQKKSKIQNCMSYDNKVKW